MAVSGFRVAFAADAATYLVSVLVVLPLPVLPQPRQPDDAGAAKVSRVRRATAGAATIARDPGLRRVALTRMGVSFTSGAFLVVEPLYARHVLHRPPAQFALFEAAIGIGAIAAGLALPVIRRRLPGGPATATTLTAGAVGYGLTAALFTGTPWIPVAYFGAGLWGAAGTVFVVVAATTLQRLAPTGRLGQVAGMISAAESAAENISMPVAGALVAAAGPRAGAPALAAVAVTTGAACLAAGHGRGRA
jgi:predicted MFS family arabinose efflux permease